MTVYGTLGSISDAQLQAALDRFGLGRLEAAVAFTDGLFGKNVGLVTDRGRWVLRGQPWPANTDEQFRRERFWAACIRERCDVPVPWPFHIEADDVLFGWPYQLTPWMPGIQSVDAIGVAALGRAAADLRRVTFPAFGSWSPTTDAIQPYDGSPLDWLTSRAQTWIDDCATDARPLTAADLGWVWSLLPTELDDVVPTYVHHDLKPGNCVCIDGEITGLFDLGEGIVGDPLEDLARSTWDLARRDQRLVAVFLRSYEAAAGVRLPLDRLWAYVVLDLIVIWQYGTRAAQAWFEEPSFRTWAEAFAAPAAEALQRLTDGA